MYKSFTILSCITGITQFTQLYLIHWFFSYLVNTCKNEKYVGVNIHSKYHNKYNIIRILTNYT